MFIDWAASLNLIDPEKNTGILKDFPLGVKKILVQQIVTYLLDNPNGNSYILSTRDHVLWVMEIIEQGFLLPIEDHVIISQCIDLYKKWLFDAKHRPLPIHEDQDEFFLKKILQHMTLVFQTRSYPQNGVALSLIDSLSREVANSSSNSSSNSNSNNNSNNLSTPTKERDSISSSASGGSFNNSISSAQINSSGPVSNGKEQQQQQQSLPASQSISSGLNNPNITNLINSSGPVSNGSTGSGGGSGSSLNISAASSTPIITTTNTAVPSSQGSTNTIFNILYPPQVIPLNTLVEYHTILCHKVLQLYLDIGRAQSKNFSCETFELWITLMLATTDSILCGNTSTDELLAKNLCPLLLKCLFEIWLHSKTRNANLWNSLSKYANGWFHHMPMVNHWNILCMAFTTPLVSNIYTNDNQSKDTATVRLEDIIFEFEKDYLYYCWHRILNLISNPNTIKNPNIFAAAIGGVFQLVSIFLSVTADGNSILHIFGSWLFETVKSIKPGFDEGISLATEILSHIFLSCSSKINFLPIYLSCFYTSIAEALWCDGKILVSTVIHTQNIFSSELPGSRILIPSYLRALNKILTVAPAGAQSEYLRKSGIKILGSILSLPNRFEKVTFFNFFPGRPIDPYPMLPNDVITKGNELFVPPSEINTFDDVKHHIAHLILSALNTEVSPNNLQILIWYILFYQLEFEHQNVSNLPDGKNSTTAFIQASINILLKKSASFSNQWPHEVICCSFQLLADLTQFYQQIPNFSEIATLVVRKLCKFITFKCKDQNMSQETEDVICLAVSVISDWVIVSPWVFEGNYLSDTSTLYMVFNALSVALGAKNPNEETSSNTSMSSSQQSGGSSSGSGSTNNVAPSPAKKPQDAKAIPTPAPPAKFGQNLPPKVKEIAQCSLKTILNRICYFPNPHHACPTNTSSKLIEFDILKQIKENASKYLSIDNYPSEQGLRFYSIDDQTIISIIDQPFSNNFNSGAANDAKVDPNSNNFVTIIIRDMSGKSIVNTQLAYLPFKPKELADDSKSSSVPSAADEAADEEIADSNNNGNTRANNIISARKNTIVTNEIAPFVSSFNENTEEFEDLSMYINKHLDENFTKLVNNQMTIEQDKLKSLEFSLNVKITINPPWVKSSYTGECKLQQARILLSHLGFLNYENKNKLIPLENSTQFFQSLHMLDQVAERAQAKIPILYVKKGDVSEDDYFNNLTVNTCSDYQDFINMLGWFVPVASHTGFLGDIDKKTFTHGHYTPYFSTHNKEMVFYVTTLMPNQENSTAQEHKKRLVNKSNACVVWYEGKIETYEKTLLDSIPNNIQIVITPLNNLLFRVKTLRKVTSSKVRTGPICEEVIVSKHVLASVVKLTIVNSNQSGLLGIDARLQHQFLQRKKLISDISESFKNDMAVNKFFSYHFEPLEQGQLYEKVELPGTAENKTGFRFVKSSSVQHRNRPCSVQVGSAPILSHLPPPPASPSVTGNSGWGEGKKVEPSALRTSSSKLDSFLNLGSGKEKESNKEKEKEGSGKEYSASNTGTLPRPSFLSRRPAMTLSNEEDSRK
ncbi:hypothetical protein CYY_000490 [Polysphondylium violaceum]|uniref:Rap-GAP domain-containing protein n=1 Tax=Polysphondylium violaceum TaxID=133409 RepID=A0A8J4Q2P9_9MYCE|nr:hypothetical protein CYY_000490 [Polysphondylium violaceum]